MPEESTRSDLPEGWVTDSWLVRSVFFYKTEQDNGRSDSRVPVVKKTRRNLPLNDTSAGQIKLVISEVHGVRRLIELDNRKSLSSENCWWLELVRTGVQLGGTGGREAAPAHKTCPFSDGTAEQSESSSTLRLASVCLQFCLHSSAHTLAQVTSSLLRRTAV